MADALPNDLANGTVADAAAVMANFNACLLNGLTNADAINLVQAIDDAAAATGGVTVGGLYRNGNVIQVRLT